MPVAHGLQVRPPWKLLQISEMLAMGLRGSRTIWSFSLAEQLRRVVMGPPEMAPEHEVSHAAVGPPNPPVTTPQPS